MLFWATCMDMEIILCEVNKTERQISYDMYMLNLTKMIKNLIYRTEINSQISKQIL